MEKPFICVLVYLFLKPPTPTLPLHGAGANLGDSSWLPLGPSPAQDRPVARTPWCRLPIISLL